MMVSLARLALLAASAASVLPAALLAPAEALLAGPPPGLLRPRAPETWKIQGKKVKVETSRALGTGGWATVYMGNYDGYAVAVKQCLGKKTIRTCVKEAVNYYSLRGHMSGHMPELYLSERDGDKNARLVLGLARGGSVDGLTKDRAKNAWRAGLAAEHKRQVLKAIFEAVARLHGLGWAHVDLSPGNVMFEKPSVVGSAVWLIDPAAATSEDEIPPPETEGIPTKYAPPEVRKAREKRRFDKFADVDEVDSQPIDVWCLAHVAITWLYGQHASFTQENTWNEMPAAWRQAKLRENVARWTGQEADPFYEKLLLWMLQPSPDDRPTAAQALATLG